MPMYACTIKPEAILPLDATGSGGIRFQTRKTIPKGINSPAPENREADPLA